MGYYYSIICFYFVRLQGAPLILKNNKWSTIQKLSIYAQIDMLKNVGKKIK